MSKAIFSFERIAKEHRRSIPQDHRRAVVLTSWVVPGLAGVLVLVGVLNLAGSDGVAFTAAATTFGALIFALAIQLFAMSAGMGTPRDEAERTANLKKSRLIRELLATVIMITVHSGIAAVAGLLAGTLVDGSWPQVIASAIAVAAFARALVLSAIALRRTYDLVDGILLQQLKDPANNE